MFMSRVQSAESQPTSVREAFRVSPRRRAAGWAIAILVELLLVLVLLTLGNGHTDRPREERKLVTFDLQNDKADDTPAPPAAAPKAKPAATIPPVPVPPVPVSPQTQPSTAPAPTPPAPSSAPTPIVPLPSFDLRSIPSSPSTSAPAPRRAAGPPSPGASKGDTPLASGHGPHGEKLYAASWYREPYDSELRGYLSTAQPDSFALIACKTVPDFRVDECVGLDEYPSGSGLMRAVLAAAWQFRVRPPQKDNQLMVGEWVRIRIDYDTVRKK